ncbi:hypothetical protein PRUPE_2G087400 [Prunus persica]|uniref:Agglutinin domain-containing protein n=1 Tax=Prunus persica TaxID=3760 RepID=A0A251QD66_PRUPE|nr:natterin-like protein [Prunus persica]ONI21764.1 hypothetical protein PRUPE_2G087400 [Prunus persica]
MVNTLPRYMVLKSKYNAKYLSYVKEDVQIHGFLKFSGEEVVSLYSKFHVEMAKGGTGLVHIRCCYNNKYWVRCSDNYYWIVAGANEPEEDQSKWFCTLFEPVYIDNNDPAQGVRFRHVQLGHYACLGREAPPKYSCLFAGSAAPNRELRDACLIVDWETLLVLPKHVSFKGDNGKYLSARKFKRHPFLQFSSTDVGESSVGNEVFSNGDGSVRIKSNLFGKFWRRSPNWIWADSDLDGNESNKDMLFWPIKLGNDNKVALRNLGNDNFCFRLTKDGFVSCLNAGGPNIVGEAYMEVGELVVSRSIYNVNFRLLDSRIYSQSVVSMATGDAVNRTQEENKINLTLSYKESKSRTWNSSVSMKLGIETKVQTGVPLIAEGQIEISAEFATEFQWGKTNTSESELGTVHEVVVPPMSRVKVSLMATRGSCDVPFSYTQRDTLIDGTTVTQDMDDGVYTGVNSYNFKFETKQESLCD